MISQIDKIQPIGSSSSAVEHAYDIGDGLGTFGAVFQSAIDNVVTTDAEKTQAQYLLATGQLDNPAELMIASSKYQIAVDLLVQLRNKALDAYSQLTSLSY